MLVKQLGLIGVAIASAASHAALVLFILPGMICRRLSLDVWRYFMGVYRGPLLAAVPFVAGALLVKRYVPAGNLLVFFVQVGALSVLYLASVYLFALDWRRAAQGARGLEQVPVEGRRVTAPP